MAHGTAATGVWPANPGHHEQKRSSLSNFFMQQAAVENDPVRRAELLDHARGSIVDPWKTLIPKVAKTVQAHADDHAALAQAAGGPPQPPTPSTAGAPAGQGQTPGTTTQPPAAQPSTSPVQPIAQAGGPGAGIGNLPIPGAPAGMANEQAPTVAPIQSAAAPSDPIDVARVKREEIINRYRGLIQQATPHMQTMLQTEMQGELQNLAPFEQQALRMHNLQGLRSTSEYKGLPDYMKISPVEEAYGFQPGSMAGMGMMMRPQSKAVDAATLERQFPGILARYGVDSAKTPVVNAYFSPYDLMQQSPPMNVEGVTPQNVAVTNQDNTRTFVPRVPGSAGVAPSEATPKTVPLMGGGVGMVSPANVAAGKAPTPVLGGVTPGLQTHTAVTSTEPTMSGGTATSRVTSVGGGPAVSGTAPAGGVSKPKESVWGGVRPFDDTVPVDHIAKLIAQDAANEKMISTRGPFSPENPSKAMVNKRLAQMGLDPNNVSGSVRDRAAVATTVLPHLDSIDSLIHQAMTDGDLGVVMTRLNDLATGKIGVDLTKGKIFSKLATDLTFVSSAIGMAHGGARAGASLPLVEHWRRALGAKDPGTLLSELGEARKWMQGYAQMAGSSKQVNTGGMSPATGSRPPLSSFGH